MKDWYPIIFFIFLKGALATFKIMRENVFNSYICMRIIIPGHFTELQFTTKCKNNAGDEIILYL